MLNDLKLGSRRPKVFMIEDRAPDFKNADAFGEINVVYSRGVRRPSVFSTSEFCDHFLAQLKCMGFDHEVDYIAINCSMSVGALAMLSIGARFAQVKILLFDARSSEYTASIWRK